MSQIIIVCLGGIVIGFSLFLLVRNMFVSNIRGHFIDLAYCEAQRIIWATDNPQDWETAYNFYDNQLPSYDKMMFQFTMWTTDAYLKRYSK